MQYNMCIDAVQDTQISKMLHIHALKSLNLLSSLYFHLYTRAISLVVLQGMYILVPPRLHIQPEEMPVPWELTQLKNCFLFNVLLIFHYS